MTRYYRNAIIFCLAAVFFAAVAVPVQAITLLGIDTGSLLGYDVTDPGNLNESGNPSPAAFTHATWIGYASGNKTFYTGEGPCGLFDNTLGGGNNKWFDDSTPSYVMLQFPTAFTLTHFTLSSANDTVEYNRNPTQWVMEASNNGTDWVPVYTYEPSGTNTFTENVQVKLFSSFSSDTLAASGLNAAQQTAVQTRLNALGKTIDAADTFTNPGAYSYYRLSISATAGANSQIGELELFGYAAKGAYIKTSAADVNTSGVSGIFTNATFHLDAADRNSITTDVSGNITAWADTDGRKLANGTALAFQTPTDGGLAGRNLNAPTESILTVGTKNFDSVHFGPTSALQINDAKTANTVFIVNKADDYFTNLAGIFGQPSDFGIRMAGTSIDNAQWQLFDGNEADYARGTTSNDTSLFGYYAYNGNQAQGPLNTFNVLTAVAGVLNLSGNNITLGAYFTVNGETRDYQGNIVEVLAFADRLSAAEVNIVQTYLGAKYGLSMSSGGASPATYNTGGFSKQQFFLAKTDHWDIHNSGAGGFGIATISAGGNSAFDLFGTLAPALTDNTVIMVTADRDDSFGTVPITVSGLDGDSLFARWDKLWYIDVANPLTGTDALILAFNAVDAMYTGAGIDGITEWNLLFSADGTNYSTLGNADVFLNGLLTFELGLDGLSPGFYGIGFNDAQATPEPSTWMLMAMGLLAGWRVVARRRKMAEPQS